MKLGQSEFIQISDDILKQGRELRFQVNGGSMRPLIKNGDILRIRPVLVSEIKTGDIILFRHSEDRLCAHRLIRKVFQDKKLKFLTKADAFISFDPWIGQEQIMGKVVGLERGRARTEFRGFYDLFQRGYGFFILLSGPLAYPVWRFSKNTSKTGFKYLVGFIQSRKIYRKLVQKIMSQAFTYAIAREEDLSDIAGFYGYNRYLDFSERLNSLKENFSNQVNDAFLIFARRKNEIIGSLALSKDPAQGVWSIESLLVSWRYRGLGVAENLVRMALRLAEENQARAVELFVFSRAYPARKLYAKLGFETIPGTEADREESQVRLRIALKDKFKNNEYDSLPNNYESLLIELALGADARHLEEKFSGELRGSGFSEKALIAAAKKEGLAALLYKNHSLESRISPKNWNELKIGYYAAVRSNLLVLETLKKVIRVFQAQGIEVIVLKGMALAEFVYQDIGMRPMADLDILVRKHDLQKANATLMSCGYKQPACFKAFWNAAEISSLNSLMYMAEEKNQPCLHLHWHLVNSTWPLDSWTKNIDMRGIWGKAESVEFDGIKALVLSSEHTLIYLCLHAIAHGFDRLVLTADIARLIMARGKDLDWKKVAKEAETWQISLIVYYALSYVQSRMDLMLPEIAFFKPARFDILKSKVAALFRRNQRGYKLSYLACLSQENGTLAKLGFLWKTVFPAKLIMAHNLDLDLARVMPFHYTQRFFNNFSGLFSR